MVKEYFIIGAGISGLTLGYELAKKGLAVRIFEKSAMPGGLARTEIVDGVHYDCGPHLFHSNNQKIQKYWTNLLGDKIATPNLYGANYISGKVYEYPLSRESISKQFSEIEVSTIERELSQRDLSNIGLSENYKDYVINLAGNFLADKFFTKYPEKLWGISTKELSAKFAPRRVEIREESRPFHSGQGKWAAVLNGGCGTLANVLEENLAGLGVHVEYGMELTDIATYGSGREKVISELIFNNGANNLDVSQGIVISTIPLTFMAKLLGFSAELWYRSLKIVSILINKEISLPGNYDWLYFDSEDVIFHRATLQNSFSKEGIPIACSIISLEIAYSNNDEIDRSIDLEIINKCLADLEKMNIVKSQDVISTHMIDAGYVYPGISMGYESELAKLGSHLDEIGNLYRHGALAEFEYSDLQVLTAKSIDLAEVLSSENYNQTNFVKKKALYPLKTIQIKEHKIGPDFPAYIIAEAGLNHNGSISLAKELVWAAKDAGADAIKFQTYAEKRISKGVRTSMYYEDLIDTQESLSDYLDRIRLSSNDWTELFRYADDVGITIFSTPFDIESLNELQSLNAPAFKISSMDLVNLPLIHAVAKTMKPVILSTGMSTLSNIEEALGIVLEVGNPNVVILHCVSAYPCPADLANLARIRKIAEIFSVIAGYSDHTTGIDISLAAISLGASVIEKHFTLNRKYDGPDHNFSILPKELSHLVASNRRIYQAKKDMGLSLNFSEISSALNLRRGLFYARDLHPGEVVQKEDLVVRSPGIGLHPRYIEYIIGSKVNIQVYQDTPVIFNHVLNR